MVKKFMYVCLGILALAVAFHLGARCGCASIVDHSTTGIIAHSSSFVLLESGEIWRCEDSPFGTWTQYVECTPPVPVSQVKFWDPFHIVTQSDEVWWYFESGEHSGWNSFGTPPGGVATQPTTWSRIKAEFGE
jgi:hypothetical protein